jgi:hypothetical protein
MTISSSFRNTSPSAGAARPSRPSRPVRQRKAHAGAAGSVAAIVLALSLAATAAEPAMPSPAHAGATSDHHGGTQPLVEKVRRVTGAYRDINVALREGWIQATPCVSGPNEGAMGVHFLQPTRLHDGLLDAEKPEMLIYEPMPGGKYRLVGVEYIVLASEWASRNAAGVAPSIDGHLANFVGEPNRYALPAFFEMHVWAWQDNPSGSFSDWNPRVSCAQQASMR